MSQDLRQSPQYTRYMEKIGWLVKKINPPAGGQFYLRHIPILGNFLKIPRPQNTISIKTIDLLAQKNRAFAVKIDYSPTKTLQLDLKPSLEEILSQTKKDCRYEIKKAKKNQIVVKKSQDIETFIKMWQKNALRRGFWLPFGNKIRSLTKAFGKNAYLLLAYHVSHITYHNPLAGALILTHDDIAYYFYAASTPEGRRLSAPYLVVWEAIKLAKKLNCQTFDFEGTYDERLPIKSWKGFTHFKKSFGGKEVEYPGPRIKFYNPVLRFFSRLL